MFAVEIEGQFTMILSKIKARRTKKCCWFHIIAASLAYIVAHVIDCILTAHGIATNASVEANPIVQGYMDYFGVGKGLIICKSFMGAIIILGVIVSHLAYQKRGKRIRVEYILYAGALFTFLGGSLWLTKF